MSSLTDRMQKALDNANLKWAKAATMLNVTPQATTKWKKGQISKENLQKFAELTNVDLMWLMTGTGDTNNGIVVGGNNVNNGTQIGTQNNYDNAEPVQHKIKTAPAINSIQAGKFTGIGDNTYDEYLPYLGDYGDDNVYWLKISGDSMLPDFKDGEYVLINKDRQAVAGNYVAALKDNDEQATFKKYRPKGYDDNGVEYFHLVPSNDEFPIIDSRFEPFTILGVAVERNQKLV